MQKVAPKKSASRGTKPAFPKKSKPASWSTDDVYTLLKAVNEVTLRRMEDKLDRLALDVQNRAGDAANTAHRIENLHWRFTAGTVLNDMWEAILAIKRKVEATS
jgi:hypothetical protein